MDNNKKRDLEIRIFVENEILDLINRKIEFTIQYDNDWNNPKAYRMITLEFKGICLGEMCGLRYSFDEEELFGCRDYMPQQRKASIAVDIAYRLTSAIIDARLIKR